MPVADQRSYLAEVDAGILRLVEAAKSGPRVTSPGSEAIASMPSGGASDAAPAGGYPCCRRPANLTLLSGRTCSGTRDCDYFGMPAQTGLQAELAWRLGRGANAADVGLMIEAGPSMAKIEQRLVVEYGIELDGVWLPMAMLRRLDEHGPWSPPFTEATTDQASVLVAHGLAQPHNDGLCRGSGLRNFVDAFPFEQTMPFNKLRSEPGGSSQPADEHSRTSGPDTGPRL